ncbi:hypothetical protein CAP31_13320 [Sulfuriferula sp. AH1]|uniref:hypothetical protein n=1 Tax=Sulfuriferula sp. AH1 TaxID=1985873 RepID=UPI000B3B10E8|nr:hypothetical protein [Sulfuriferula sp. AH1]ARU32573.1 hypothetical protein CAP31_13320 [Sulfuriferula sp. AH1]
MKYYGIALVAGWLLAANTLAAQPVGRLFYTPQQRLQLDMQHKPRVHHAAAIVYGDTHYNGYVIRSDGINTLWVNGQTRYVDHAANNPARLKLPATPVLKPGQAFDRQAGRVLEPYEIATPAERPAIPAVPLPSPLADDGNDAAVQADNVAVH